MDRKTNRLILTFGLVPMGIFALIALFPWAWENAFWLVNAWWTLGCISAMVFCIWGMLPHVVTAQIRPLLIDQKHGRLEPGGYGEKVLRNFNRTKFLRIYLKPDIEADNLVETKVRVWDDEKYRQLDEGEEIQEGDEVLTLIGWQPTSKRRLGKEVPSP